VEKLLQARHVSKHETAVLADGVAAQRRLARRHMLRQKRQQRILGLRLGNRGRLDLVDQAALAVRGLVPAVHGVEQAVGLVHHQHGALGHDGQVGFRHHHGDFDDAFFLGVQAGHFHVQPNQAVFVHSHIICL
jgi:hypothetical protein